VPLPYLCYIYLPYLATLPCLFIYYLHLQCFVTLIPHHTHTTHDSLGLPHLDCPPSLPLNTFLAHTLFTHTHLLVIPSLLVVYLVICHCHVVATVARALPIQLPHVCTVDCCPRLCHLYIAYLLPSSIALCYTLLHIHRTQRYLGCNIQLHKICYHYPLFTPLHCFLYLPTVPLYWLYGCTLLRYHTHSVCCPLLPVYLVVIYLVRCCPVYFAVVVYFGWLPLVAFVVHTLFYTFILHVYTRLLPLCPSHCHFLCHTFTLITWLFDPHL